MTRGEKAEAFFREGYGCAQSVVLAFTDETGLPKETLASLASPFGGGLGRMREVCGAVSGAAAVLGLLRGSPSPDRAERARVYAETREFADRFKEKHGSVVCREIMAGVKTSGGPFPAERNEEFYRSRPCLSCVRDAADILEKLLSEKENENEKID
ncbi:MAG: C_GCAxxG_C_C family protein [Clostridia bacterium]|nr:C_GCAxxG_C_C family protein [Clostridia bacterium]